MLGDGGGPTYKKSRRGDAEIDRAMVHALHQSGLSPVIEDFSPYGYDERQYCSPGFNLPVGLFQRSKFGSIPEYHTSADNLDFISPEHLGESYRLISDAIGVVEGNRILLNTVAKGEPQLGRRGLYGAIGGDKDAAAANMAMLWVLNLSDGEHSLLDIAERAKLPFAVIRRTAELLRDARPPEARHRLTGLPSARGMRSRPEHARQPAMTSEAASRSACKSGQRRSLSESR